MAKKDANQELLVSYLTLRKVVGALGMLLPIIVAVWGFFLLGWWRLEPSISDYYCLRTRDAFVGILFTIGWFLFTYRGYDRRDEIAGNIACLCALCVALFPDSGPGLEPVVHYVAAGALFLVLSYFALFLFTLSAPSPTPQKKKRNVVYGTCGVVMLGCSALMVLYHLVHVSPNLAALKPVFWLESIALWAFGFSWFVKGETLWRDVEP